MTASTTPRMGLMRPTGTDDFLIADFVATMDRLDESPGITPIPNFSSLPTGLTSAQHGSCWLQTDNGSLWMWNKPGGGAGTWKKINSVGMLASGSQGSAQSTASTVLASGATLVSLNYTAAGGRRVLCFFSHAQISNSGSYGYSQVGIFVDGGSGPLEVSVASGGAPNKSISHRLLQDLGVPAAGDTHTVVAKMASVSSAGAGTTSTHASGQMYIWEL